MDGLCCVQQEAPPLVLVIHELIHTGDKKNPTIRETGKSAWKLSLASMTGHIAVYEVYMIEERATLGRGSEAPRPKSAPLLPPRHAFYLLPITRPPASHIHILRMVLCP